MLVKDLEHTRSAVQSAAADALRCAAPRRIVDRLLAAAQRLEEDDLLVEQRQDTLVQARAALIAWKSWRDTYCK